MLFWAPGTLFLRIRENCNGNCLGSRAPSFQNDELQRPPPLGTSAVESLPRSEATVPVKALFVSIVFKQKTGKVAVGKSSLSHSIIGKFLSKGWKALIQLLYSSEY